MYTDIPANLKKIENNIDFNFNDAKLRDKDSQADITRLRKQQLERYEETTEKFKELGKFIEAHNKELSELEGTDDEIKRHIKETEVAMDMNKLETE